MHPRIPRTMTQTTKFTLWTDPRNKDLLERVRARLVSEISHSDLRALYHTYHRCDFCGYALFVSHDMIDVVCDPERYIFEGEFVKCWRCRLPNGSRILCPPDHELLFYVHWEFYLCPPCMFVYNVAHDYFVPSATMYRTLDSSPLRKGLARRTHCNLEEENPITQCITSRTDPYYQIDRSLFQILYDSVYD